MKKSIKLFVMLLFTTLNFFSQENPAPIGYKLKPSPTVVFVYRNDSDNKPDLNVRNIWDNRYWFKLDNSSSGKYEDKSTKIKYIRFTIVSESRYDDTADEWVNTTGYNIKVTWEQDELIDGSDFNTWLWMSESDFDSLKIEYSKIRPRFVLSGLTVPFKFRPSNSKQPSSMINGDINLGTFIGVRLSRNQNFGISIGAHGGISSISLNAANNTALKDNKTETIQGFTYGAGIIVDIKKKFQIGVIAAYDYGLGDLSKTYVYQNNLWFAFSLNYKFLDFGDDSKDTNKKKAPNEAGQNAKAKAAKEK